MAGCGRDEDTVKVKKEAGASSWFLGRVNVGSAYDWGRE